MLNLILLLIGDAVVVMLQGFYMGVGIWQSSGWLNISAMTIPCILVWFAVAKLLKIYPSAIFFHNLGYENQDYPLFKSAMKIFAALFGVQKILRLIALWLISSCFSVFWYAFYWRFFLQHDRNISIGFLVAFCTTGAFFLCLWRIGWVCFVFVRISAKRNRFVRTLCYVATISFLLLQIPAIVITAQTMPRKYSLDAVLALENQPFQNQSAVVFGAGVYRNGQPSGILRDRISTAVRLYENGAVKELIMSGDNSALSRHETQVMADTAISQGVPEQKISQDENGVSTSATCINMSEEYGLKQAVLVTQNFHTTRSLYVCTYYGIDAVSVSADLAGYNLFGWINWTLRDWFGVILQWFLFTF